MLFQHHRLVGVTRRRGYCGYYDVIFQYIAKLMEWIEKQINTEELFPVQIGKSLGHAV